MRGVVEKGNCFTRRRFRFATHAPKFWFHSRARFRHGNCSAPVGDSRIQFGGARPAFLRRATSERFAKSGLGAASASTAHGRVRNERHTLFITASGEVGT